MLALVRLVVVAVLAGSALAQGVDLGKQYPATKHWSEYGLSWTSDPEDVWELSSFDLEQGSGFRLRGKSATLVLGRNETNVLWAALYPDKPAKLLSPLAGDKETANEIFLRFAPADLPKLFPKKTVKGPGDASKRARAVRLFTGKIGWKWSTGSGNTTIVPQGVLIVDFDSLQGTRRFFAMDRNRGQVEYVDEFEQKLLPPLTPIAPGEAFRAFAHVWESFDAEYPKFGRFPELDWKKRGKEYGKRAKRAETTLDLAALIADGLVVLEDLHVWVKEGTTFLPGFSRPRPLNANFDGSKATVGALTKGGSNLWFGRTDDDVGYLNVHGLSDRGLVDQVDAALEELGDTWALVLDLRFNGGGDESLAQRIAGRFVDEARVYSKNRYRSGKDHDDLGPVLDRVVAPREDAWRFAAPVIVLQGRKTLSSAESFAAMMKQAPNANVLGSYTGGSSGNPRRIELDCGIQVNLPRWLDMDEEGNPVEGVGIAPDEVVEFEPDAYTAQRDPLLLEALERLRAIPAGDRRSGKRVD